MSTLAILWTKKDRQRVRCDLCAHFCELENEEKGKCGVRVNINGVLHTLVEEKVAAVALDPVEKKPLFHFLPATPTLSLGTMGCNFACKFCQNYTLAHSPKQGLPIQGKRLYPEQIVQSAQSYQASSISYTYSEPTIFIELLFSTAKLAQEHQLKNIIVSNGYQSPKTLDLLSQVIDAANIDLKSFNNDFYQNYCGAKLKPVLKNLEKIKKMGWWLEITTLIIPGLNDSEQELTSITNFIVNHLGKDTPWHVSRFYPCYQLNYLPPTPVSTLKKAYQIAKSLGLNYVYLGNVPGVQEENTFCPECGQLLIQRQGFAITQNKIKQGKCPACNFELAGVWS